jgi:hypothetical protein
MGTALTPTGITFSDSTTQTTAYAAQLGNTSENALFFGGTPSGGTGAICSILNTINSQGVTSQDTVMSNNNRNGAAGGKFGTGSGYYFGGYNWGTIYGFSNYYTTITGNGVFSSDSTSVGTARGYHACVNYGGNLSLIIYGYTGSDYSRALNLVSSVGVIAADVTAAQSARSDVSGFSYGGDKGAVFGKTAYNLVSNTGSIAADVSTSTTFTQSASATYGYDKGIVFIGALTGYRVSNTGVFTSVTPSPSSSANRGWTGAVYGGDKAMIAYGSNSGSSVINSQLLISNTGIYAAERSGVGTAREYPAATSIT